MNPRRPLASPLPFVVAAATLILVLVPGCSLSVEPPPCPDGVIVTLGACVTVSDGLDRDESVAFADRVTKLVGIDVAGLEIHLAASSNEVELEYGYVDGCVNGFMDDTKGRTVTIPEALVHELTHRAIYLRGEGPGWQDTGCNGNVHQESCGWREEDRERIRALRVLTPPPERPRVECD